MSLPSGGLFRFRHACFSLFGLTCLLSLPTLIVASVSYDPFSAAARCPLPCQATVDHSGWSLYRDASQLDNCNQTILLDLNLNHGLESKALPVPFRACSVQQDAAVPVKRQAFSFSSSNGTNSTSFDTQLQTQDIQIVRWRGQANSSSSNGAAITAATSALAQAVKSLKNGSPTILLAKSGPAIMGVYAGSQIENQGFGGIIQQFAEREAGHQVDLAAVQLCGPDSLGSQILGIFVDTTGGDLHSVKAALGNWNNATCLDSGGGETETWPAVPISMVPGKTIAVGPTDGGTPGHSDSDSNVVKRATCSYTQAVSGDGCWSIATRCGITQTQLISYNNNPNLCSSLQVGQYVCCSSGTLPDFTPQPNHDGTCKSYKVQSGDYCAAIAQANTMAVADIENRNKNTWGWTGCSYLLVGEVICLSTGSPPMPGAVANAVCGPTVPGTTRPADMSTLAQLNPCPLNVCCNVWGQCGITKDFCVSSPADTGAPGTATPGSNGCVSSCGMAITNNGAPPANFKVVGYWEAWNGQRPCLHMKANQIDTTRYTHVHFAFGTITSTFDVGVGNLTSEFADFKALTGVKRILSFGGWSFSTDYDTFPIFRQGVTGPQRQTFANKVAAFIVSNGLDGVDFDWEYPGAPDIPGIPPGSPSDGPNYLAFLQMVRAALPASHSIAIAAPASYWYLRGFPIASIANVVDYIVYMTYDLHGQWDYGNAWSDDGCPGGNCLRSHINKTETASALAMITHAGVQASKVVVGTALYGRSFQMTTPGCYGVACTYVGPASGATPGKCTGTAGYISNFEIRNLIATTGNVQQYSSGEGDILIYNDVQWVSWMQKQTYDSRVSWIRGLNFGGTSDWAIDLDADYSPSEGPGQGDSGSGPIYVSPDVYSQPYPVIQCYPPCTLILPPFVLPNPTTITMAPVTVTYKDTWSTTVTISGAVVTTSVGSTTSTVITLPPITTQTIYVSNVVWDPTTVSGRTTASSTTAAAIIWLTSSIIPPPVTITQSQTRSAGPPVTWTYSPGPYPTPSSNGPWPPPPPPPPPPSGFPSTVSVRSGPPQPTCRPGQICGLPCHINCASYGCLFLCGCIGPFCPSSGCVGPLCPPGNCVGAGCIDTGGSSSNPSDSTCRAQITASYCNVECNLLKYPMTTTTTCNNPKCTRTVTACSATDSTTTTTTTLTCPTSTLYDYGSPDDQVPLLGDGGYGGIIVDQGNFNVAPTAETITTTVYLSPTPVTVYSTVIVAPTVSANCDFWDAGVYYTFKIHNIQSWALDQGSALHDQETGCGALTQWSWTPATGNSLAYAYFNLPLLIGAGCVERAIVAAGGPKISCSWDWITPQRRQLAIDSGAAADPNEKMRQRDDEAFAAAALRRTAADENEKGEKIQKRSTTTQSPTSLTVSTTPTSTYSLASTKPAYIPMTWDTNNTVILTWTQTSTGLTSYTTTITIPGYTRTSASSASTSGSPFSSSSSHKTTSASPVSGPTSTSATSTSHSTSSSSSSSQSTANTSHSSSSSSSSSSAAATATVISSMTFSIPPQPTNTGSTAQCNTWYTVQAGDTCQSIDTKFDITTTELVTWNTYINAACTNLRTGYSLCISSPITPSTYLWWTPLGCYADSASSRTLQYNIMNSPTKMTIETCQSACLAAGYSLAGVEWGQECFCDNTLYGSLASDGNTQCNVACSGNAAETCGGSLRIDVYMHSKTNALGCFADSASSRTLSQYKPITNQATVMTLELCQSTCLSEGYLYSGVEWGQECFCDNNLYGSPAPGGNTGCNMNCPGNSSETCGGNLRLSVTSLPPYRPIGCYTDSPSSRTLNNYILASQGSSMTIETCQNGCRSLGYRLAGIEYAQECFCDNDIQGSGQPAPRSSCNMACAGNSAEICGGNLRISVFAL